MPFRFRLAAVLLIRRRREELQALALATRLRERATLTERLADQRERATAGRAALLADGRRGITALAIVRHANVTAFAMMRAAHTIAYLTDVTTRLRALHDDLTVAAKERRAVERLEARHREVHDQRQHELEQKQLDEVAGSHHLRRSIENDR